MDQGKPEGVGADYKESVDAAGKARRQTEGAPAPVIPDCCNIGVGLRAVMLLNAAALAIAIGLATDLAAIWPRLLGIALVLEPALLGSLAALCLIRKWVNGRRLQIQWAVALGVPATVTAAVAWLLAGFALPGESTAATLAVWVLTRAVVAALVAAAACEYFRLRARAYAPSFSEARLQALQARIRPHFLFNSFNTLITVIEKDPNLAVEYVENLSQFFRSIVSYKDVEVISLEEEIGLLENYIFIQSKRYGDSLKFINKVDLKIAPDGFIPPLTLQLLAENALKHNAISHESPLLLELFIKDGYLVMRNNINPKYHKEESTGIGLQNIKNRFNILGDQKIEIEVDQDFFNVSVPILKEI